MASTIESHRHVISLDGDGWLGNFFQPGRGVSPGEFDIEGLHLSDGIKSGAPDSQTPKNGWLPARVPSDVRDVLRQNGQLDDPYFARNSYKSRWVEDMEWWFVREVTIPPEWHDRRVFLRFEGVDYLADYWWNGRHLGSSADMFVPVEFELDRTEGTPRSGLLAVRLLPPPKSSCNHYFDGRIPERTRHHKMQAGWGWDWSRPMVGIGIWDSVCLYATKAGRIRNVFVQAEPVALSEGKRSVAATANVRVNLEIENPGDQECLLEIFAPDGTRVHSQTFRAAVKSSCEIILDDALLWWPNGYGAQPLYRYAVHLGTSDTCRGHFGIRRLRMRANDEKEAGAHDLTFEVNGVKIFALGANWVPADLLVARLEETRYRQFLQIAKDIGFNMLRVWGGGLVEKDAFYTLADEMGIMIWQEFPLSCANYPEDEKFLSEKTAEAREIVKKLRNHPCIALWCGGNEMDYYGMSMDHPVLKIFGDVVRELHPGLDYHASSPDNSRPGERDHGPWEWKEHRFWNEHFREFISEFGCNGLPDLRSLQEFIPSDELWPPGPSYAHHFCVLSNFKRAAELQPATLEEWISVSQKCQADQLSYVFSLARTRQFRTSGVLLWQFNSAWPEGGWGIVDYYGRTKAACAELKEICRPVTVVILDEEGEGKGRDLVFWLVNGFPEPCEGTCKMLVRDERGGVLFSDSLTVRAAGYQTLRLRHVPLPAALGISAEITLESPAGQARQTWSSAVAAGLFNI
jgi:beta-mannosidase